MKFFKIFGLGACLFSSSVMAQVTVEAETASLLNGTIKVNGTVLDGIKAIVPGGVGTYDAKATWAEYKNVSIPTAGDYSLITKTSGFSATATIEVYINNISKGTITTPATGGWGTYLDSNPLAITLPAGNITIKLGFGSSTSATGFLMNIDKFTISPATVTSLKEMTSNDIKVLVNKQQKSLRIESEKHQKADVSLYDIKGSCIKSFTMVDGNIEINTNDLKKGVYIVQVITNGGKFAKKILL